MAKSRDASFELKLCTFSHMHDEIFVDRKPLA